jgi:two-component system, OmpR family, sensor kinase
MKRPERTGRRTGLSLALSPSRWPVRWRLAGVSAALTLVILVCFAVIVGRLATDRLHDDFQDELRSGATAVSQQVHVESGSFLTPPNVLVPNLDRMTLASGDDVRLVGPGGTVFKQTDGAPDLGPPNTGVQRFGDYEIATAPVLDDEGRVTALFVQYARHEQELDSTINRLWLLLVFGVVGGTGLAALAGFAVASRAMRPIAALTATAREIASTRDTSRRIPVSERDDEITELGRTLDQMLRELDAARSETQQMIQAQREFIADASHELRTPLTSILANLELLHAELSEAERTGEQGEMVESALASSQRMRRLIADLLLLARADAGRTGIRRECDLSEIAEAAVAEVRPTATGHHLELDRAQPVAVEGDPDELHRLAVNLLDNGLRHTPDGSEIEVAVERRNGSAVLEVSDDGPGIPEAERDQVFSRFARLGGPGDVIADSGTGLGLAIVRAVATSHGGSVEVGDSDKGGARFTVRLPTSG